MSQLTYVNLGLITSALVANSVFTSIIAPGATSSWDFQESR